MYGYRYTKRQEIRFWNKYKPEISLALILFGITTIISLLFVFRHFIAF
jgi:hypothetical protein